MASVAAAGASTAMEVEGPLAGSLANMGLNGSENVPPPAGVTVVVPKAELVKGKPADMEQSFFDQLMAAKIPMALIHYMSDQYINCLTDFPHYCFEKKDIMTLLLDAVEETRGERKFMVPLTKLWAAASVRTELATKRQSEGMTEAEMEVPIPAEDMSLLLTRFKSAYGYTPDDYDRLWPHMMGRVRKELEMKAWTVIPLNRCGAEVEGSKSPGTQSWKIAPGLVTTAGGMSGTTRTVRDNHMLMTLLNQLMTAYVITGNFEVSSGVKWCSLEAAYEYLQFTRKRVCPPHEDWPPLQRCLDSEIEARGAWMPLLREGKSLTEAITLTRGERAGSWNWATPQLNAAYFNVAKASNASGSGDMAGGSSVTAPRVGNPSGSGRQRARAKSRGVSSGPPPQAKRSRQQQRSAAPQQGSGTRNVPGQPAVFSARGNRFCEKFSKGGCVNGANCPDGDVHACNFVNDTGRVCGAPGKRRCNHGVDHAT